MRIPRIYQLEKRINQRPADGQADAESSPLLGSLEEDTDKTFSLALDRELEKICSFYQLKELEIYGELEHVLKEEQAAEQEFVESTETAVKQAIDPLLRAQHARRVFLRTLALGSDEELAL